MSGPTPFRVALTFDAEHPDRPWCPADATEHIVDTLRAEEVRATMFLQGRWVMSQPAMAKRIADDGHLLGNHTHYHARLPLLSDEGIEADLRDAAEAIEMATATDPRPWFRCPFGEGHDDPRVLSAVTAVGYRNVHWHIELDDWEPWRTGEAIATDAIDRAREHGDGAVILLHTWPGGTAEALPSMLGGLREAGASFVAVDELEELP